VATFSNGDKVMQEVLKANAYGVYQYRVIADRTDGVAVELDVSNGSLSGPGTKFTRADPPLSLGVWTVFAVDQVWQPRVPSDLAAKMGLSMSPIATPTAIPSQ
jgi:hypothetical protein